MPLIEMNFASGSGGNSGNVVFGTNKPLTQDTYIECGFRPTTIVLIIYINSSPYKYIFTYSSNVTASNQVYMGADASTGKNNFPSTFLGLSSIDDNGFTVHYTSTQTAFDYIATSEI